VAGRCNASQDAQDAWDAENTSLASGRNADGSEAGSIFADVPSGLAVKISRTSAKTRSPEPSPLNRSRSFSSPS